MHRIGPLGVRVRDPFGLTLRTAAVSGDAEIVVLPKVVPLPHGRSLGSGIGSEGSIPHMVALHGEDDQTVREYRDGDDLRRIHWPATARTGELMVRQEDRPAKRRAVVVLDTRSVGHGGSGRSSSLEWCVTTAASVTAHVVDAGYAVHLLTADARADNGVHHDETLPEALESLARVGLGPEDGLRAVLHAANALTSQGGLVVYVGGPVGDDDARTLSALRQPGSAGAAMVVDPDAFAGRTRRGGVDRQPGRRVPGHPAVVGLDDDPGRRAHHAGARVGGRRRRPGRGGPVNRVRPVEALLAAVATLAVTLPLTTLFTPSTWFRPSVLLVVVVALVGMGLRRITANRPLVVLGQVVLLVNAASLLHGRGHLFAGVLPTPETGRAFGILLQEAQTTVTNYTAPAPSNRATILAISLLIGLTAVAVDAIGVTYRSPALAGIPLLSAFLASATNSGDGLGAWYAVPGALAWLALVGRQGVRSLRAWGTASPHSSSGPLADPTTAFATLGRVVGVGALGVAIVLPGLVPHFPTTFLADGLGRSADGRGGSGSNVRLASSIDIARDLGSRSTDPVFRYRSTSDRLEPLRVSILDTYRRGKWRSSSDFTFVPVDGQIPGPIAGPEVPRRVERISVVENAIGVPQVALPPGAVGTPFPAGTWNMTVPGLVQLTAPATSYSTEFVELDPEDGQFSADLDNPQIEGNELEVDPAAEAEVRAVLDEITDDGDSALQIARKVQAYLRGPTFSYSVELADQAADGNLSDEPLARFLETKRGYCVQFASAMVMLSRAAGIPARMATGFLPGSIDGDDRVVRLSDAHAWPELYFPRLGWVRFEPTPGTRSGVAPEYSLGAAERRVVRQRQPDHLVVDVVGLALDRSVARRDRRPDRHDDRHHRYRRACGS